MKKTLFILCILSSYLPHSTWANQAQPVPIPEDQSTTPQIQISGVGVTTLNASKLGENGSNRVKSGINFSDSAFLLGAAQRMSDGKSIGSMGLGWLTLDQTNQGLNTQFFVHQAFLDYQSESFEMVIGRTDNPTAHVVDFPTLRGDDLVTLTNPTNPFSNGVNQEEHRYSNVVSATINQGLKYYENIHVQHLINSSGIGSSSEINSFGASFQYLSPPGMEPFSSVPFLGFGVEHMILNSNTSDGLHQVYGGGVINLNESVTKRWDLRVQDIASFGSTLRSFSNATDSFQASSNLVSASIRHLSSPFGRPGYQFSITGAYKNYFNVNASNTWGGAITGVKRLGQGFDLVAQYQGQWRDRSLASVQSSGIAFEQIMEVGFVFSFDATFNDHLPPRRTLLNQGYRYLPN